jgi:putative ABC transport system permease protein
MRAFLASIAGRVRLTLRRGRVDDEIRHECETHVDLLVARYIRAGMSERDAQSAAQRQFGNATLVREDIYVMNSLSVEPFLQDFRYAGRSLRKSPAFTLAAMLTLGLGIGANTAIFSVMYGVLVRPLPYEQPSQLVRISATTPLVGALRNSGYSGVEYSSWSESLSGVQSLAAFSPTAYALFQDEGTSSVPGAIVSANFFTTVGGSSSVGRFFTPSDVSAPVAVISTRLWQRQFGGSPKVVGQLLSLDDTVFTVIGVASPSFALPSAATDVWTPLEIARASKTSRVNDPNNDGFIYLARLERGATRDQVQQSAENAAHSLASVAPPLLKNRRPFVQSLTTFVVGDVRASLLILFAAVSIVLLVACLNVTNLFITRNLTRSRELALLSALGASRMRLLSRCFAEVALLGAGAGLLAVALAWSTIEVLVALDPQNVPRLDAVRLDAPVFFFALALGLLTIALVSIMSVWSVAWRDLSHDLKASGGTTAGGTRATRVRGLLVVGELATSFVLIVSAVLLARSLSAMLQTDIGVTADHTLMAFLDLNLGRPVTRAGGDDQNRRVNALIAQARFVPGVTEVGVSTSLPAVLSRTSAHLVVPDPSTGADRDFLADIVPITPTYLRALGIPLLRGRSFSETDGTDGPAVALLSVSTARAFFGSEDVVGRVLPPPPRGVPMSVVGVVADVTYRAVTAPAQPVVYVPYAQRPFRAVYLFARTNGDPTAIVPGVRHAIAEVDPHIAVVEARPLADVVRGTTAQPRLQTAIFVALAISALLLAAVGLSGVIAHSVSQQTREIGIRIALGATRQETIMRVLQGAARLAMAGVAGGLTLSLGLTSVLKSALYGVTNRDPWSFIAASLLLLVVALLASYFPARRAARVDPIVALRAE